MSIVLTDKDGNQTTYTESQKSVSATSAVAYGTGLWILYRKKDFKLKVAYYDRANSEDTKIISASDATVNYDISSIYYFGETKNAMLLCKERYYGSPIVEMTEERDNVPNVSDIVSSLIVSEGNSWCLFSYINYNDFQHKYSEGRYPNDKELSRGYCGSAYMCKESRKCSAD